MSGKQAETRSHLPEDSAELRQDEHMENQLTPSHPDRLHNHHDGAGESLPFTSPYNTDINPQFTSINRASPYDTTLSSLPNNATSLPTEGSSRPLNPARSAAADYSTRLAAVNGIVSPSLRAPGEKPLVPAGAKSKLTRRRTNFCPICRTDYEIKSEVRSHFVACVGRNGNPKGWRWDDGSTGRSTKSLPPSHRTVQMRESLNAVNGVVIPSKLAPGESPKTVPSLARPGASLDFMCPLCDQSFGKKDHVKSHFPACVNRNGNPDGLRWDEDMPWASSELAGCGTL